MDLRDVFVGQAVSHVRGDFQGTVVEVIEQPEPFPAHVSVRLLGSQSVVCAPINQLRDDTPIVPASKPEAGKPGAAKTDAGKPPAP